VEYGQLGPSREKLPRRAVIRIQHLIEKPGAHASGFFLADKKWPMLDALIAATASLHDAALVHRDPHFRAILGSLMRQLDLGETGRPAL
jgi:predicted nucleic acid-binding protein